MYVGERREKLQKVERGKERNENEYDPKKQAPRDVTEDTNRGVDLEKNSHLFFRD